MFGKKVLAGFFAVVVLLKLLAVFVSPERWMGFAGVLLEHHGVATVVYLVLIALTGYYVFTGLDLIDIAVVMFFTASLVALTLIPYSDELLKFWGGLITVSLAKSWLATIIWGVLAVAVLYRIFSGKGANPDK